MREASLGSNHSLSPAELGEQQTDKTRVFIETLEKLLGLEAVKEFVGMQPGDVDRTCANVDAAKALVGYQPTIDIAEGFSHFVEWYRNFYR